jgi:hypothetical protein
LYSSPPPLTGNGNTFADVDLLRMLEATTHGRGGGSSMRAGEPDRWHKSSLCDTGSCVEAAQVGDSVAVRDAKDPNGPILRFSRDEWDAFIAGVRRGEFDLSDRATQFWE